MSKVDEAADSWSYNNHTNYDDEDADGFMYCCSRPLAEAGFKAGALWLLKQARALADRSTIHGPQGGRIVFSGLLIERLEALCSAQDSEKEVL